MKIRYARVSTQEPDLHLQREGLKKTGSAKVVTEKGITGTNIQRECFDHPLKQINKGDVLVVWNLTD